MGTICGTLRSGNIPASSTPTTGSSDSGDIISGIVSTVAKYVAPVVPTLATTNVVGIMLALLAAFRLMSRADDACRIVDFVKSIAFCFVPFLVTTGTTGIFHIGRSLTLFVTNICLDPAFMAVMTNSTTVALFNLPVAGTACSCSIVPIVLVM